MRETLSGSAEPSAPALGWVWATSGAPADHLVTHGPATRVAPADDQTLSRPDWVLRGSFAVGATFERSAQSLASAVYGLTLGTTESSLAALAVLIRPDGAIAIQRGPAVSATRGEWQRTPALRAVHPDGAAVDHLEVRVEETTARVFVNRQAVASLPIEPGALDGSPGVHVGAGGDVLVVGLTIERPAAEARR